MNMQQEDVDDIDAFLMNMLIDSCSTWRKYCNTLTRLFLTYNADRCSGSKTSVITRTETVHETEQNNIHRFGVYSQIEPEQSKMNALFVFVVEIRTLSYQHLHDLFTLREWRRCRTVLTMGEQGLITKQQGLTFKTKIVSYIYHAVCIK